MDGSGATAAPRGCAGCTPAVRSLRPVPDAGCKGCTPSGQLSTVSAGSGDCSPSAAPPASGHAATATLAARPGNWCSSAARSASVRSSRIRLRSRSQPFGRRPARLIRAATISGSHGRADPRRVQPVQAGPHRPLGQGGVPDERGHRRERARAVRPGMDWPGRAARTCTRWTAARPGRPGPGPGSAPRRSPRRARYVAPQTRCPVGGRPAPVSVSVSFAPVRRRSPAAAPVMSGQVTDGGGHW